MTLTPVHTCPTPLQDHVQQCGTCQRAMLRSIFKARPFVDEKAGGDELDWMCSVGKGLAVLEHAAKHDIALPRGLTYASVRELPAST